MPYILKKDREAAKDMFKDSGDFAYKLTTVYLEYLEQNGLRFKYFASLVGVVVLSLLELWRRVICPYEDRKRMENGDVY